VLARAGLRRDGANPRIAVQVMASDDSMVYGPTWGGSSVGIGIGGGGWGGGSAGIGFGFPIGGTAVYPSQRVDVIMRDLANGRVIFQAQASNNSGVTTATLVEAAPRGFPNMPPGSRVVPLFGPVGF
jgi:hypothetical protein